MDELTNGAGQGADIPRGQGESGLADDGIDHRAVTVDHGHSRSDGFECHEAPAGAVVRRKDDDVGFAEQPIGRTWPLQSHRSAARPAFEVGLIRRVPGMPTEP